MAARSPQEADSASVRVEAANTYPKPSRHRHIPARPVRPHPEGDPSRAAHAAAGRAPPPQDEARPARLGDAFQVVPACAGMTRRSSHSSHSV